MMVGALDPDLPVFFNRFFACDKKVRSYNSSPRNAGVSLRSLRLVVQDAALSRR